MPISCYTWAIFSTGLKFFSKLYGHTFWWSDLSEQVLLGLSNFLFVQRIILNVTKVSELTKIEKDGPNCWSEALYLLCFCRSKDLETPPPPSSRAIRGTLVSAHFFGPKIVPCYTRYRVICGFIRYKSFLKKWSMVVNQETIRN